MPFRRAALSISVSAVAALLLGACGGEKTTGPAAVASITVSPTSLTLKVGETQTVSATLTDAKGAAITGRTISWSVADVSVAQVSSSGIVTGVAPGQTVITASSDGRSALVSVSVIRNPSVINSLRLQLSRPSIETSESTQIVAEVLDQYGTPMPGQTVTWTSSDTTIASVSSTGMAFGETSGTVTVTATVGAIRSFTALTVNKSLRYKKWLAIKALGDTLRALRARAGTFGSAVEIDLDADGDKDLLALENAGAGETAGELRLFRSVADTLFVPIATSLKTIVGSIVLTVADINGDGREDVFAPSFGVDAPPFPGARQRLFLQAADGSLTDRSDLMPARRAIGHAGCVSPNLKNAMIVGGNNQMTLRWNGNRFEETKTIVPVINYDDRPPNWNPQGERASYMSYWVCAFFDADGDGAPDILLGSGNTTGLDPVGCCGVGMDVYSNKIGASHAILWGSLGSDTLRYDYPTSVVPSAAASLVPLRKIDYIQRIVTDLDGDGCADVALFGTDYSRNYLVDVVKGCVSRQRDRLLASYRWDVQGSYSDDVHYVSGLEMAHGQASIIDANSDGIKDVALMNDNCYLAECDGNIGMQVRIGINDGTGHFSWRRAVHSDFSTLPLRAQILKGWRWDPRAK